MSDAFVPMPPEDAEALVAYRPMSRTGLTGAAGEYHIAAELSRRGWLATVTIKNAPGTDVLAEEPTRVMSSRSSRRLRAAATSC